MEKVSVIIPVYNVKTEYMQRCIASILCQSYSNLEVIIVDDGSREETYNFCDSIALEDCRIKVFHKKNEGVSIARNFGMQQATGDFVIFSDADDIMTPYAIEQGVSYIHKTEADMVVAAVSKITPEENFDIQPLKEEAPYKLYVQSANMDELRRQYLMIDAPEYANIRGKGYVGRGPWARIIRAHIAKQNPFDLNLALGEDVLWNMRFTNICNKICVVQDIWYGYVIYDSSAVRKYYGNRKQILDRYMEILWKENCTYCKKNTFAFAKNMAMEFYCLVQYEIRSEKNPLSSRERRKLIKKYLHEEPWKLLIQRKVLFKLPHKYMLFISMCGCGFWKVT